MYAWWISLSNRGRKARWCRVQIALSMRSRLPLVSSLDRTERQSLMNRKAGEAWWRDAESLAVENSGKAEIHNRGCRTKAIGRVRHRLSNPKPERKLARF